MINKKTFLLFSTICIIIYIVSNFLVIGNSSFSDFKKKISNETKQTIKKYIFPYRYIDENLKTIKAQRVEIKSAQKSFDNINATLDQNNIILNEMSEILGFTEFMRYQKKTVNVNKNDFIFTKFENYYLKVRKAGAAGSGAIYAEKFDNKIILASGDGNFYFFEKELLNNKNFKAIKLKSNIKEIIKYKDFYISSKYGIKDLFLMDNKIYISFINQINKSCFNTSIMVAELNFKKLVFKSFFSPDECIDSNTPWFQPHSSGGRMFQFEDKIIFSTGEFLNRAKAQDEKSVFGKILILNPNFTNDKVYKIISLGHRNVQGLYVDAENSTIISTEHGPQGGDEININKNLSSNIINNYGWPVSSYGEHYGFAESDPSTDVYKVAPLHKSHKKYGFIEPIKYFVPSIGISQIVKVDNNFINHNGLDNQLDTNNFIIGALGKKDRQLSVGTMSFHFFKINKEYSKILNHEFINIDERVRDVIVIDEDQVLFTLESASTLGILTKK